MVLLCLSLSGHAWRIHNKTRGALQGHRSPTAFQKLLLWVELCPPNNFEVLTRRTCESDLFGNKVFADVIQLR